MTGSLALLPVLKIPANSSTRSKYLSTLRMSSASSSAEAKTVNVRVKGVVQGVFYRKFTAENAQQLGLKGWVRNRRDGTVEAVFSGDTKSVDDMLERCKRGPPAAVVTAVNVNPTEEPVGETFELKPTQ
uniref:acylphosphatase n=1 Tax=Wollemia nobilis TaxID=56998 RepID=A0A0C9RL93_9CONI